MHRCTSLELATPCITGMPHPESVLHSQAATDQAPHCSYHPADETAGTGAASQQQAQQKRPVWHDPYDKQVKVDVKAAARLRKLRTAENQQQLSGAKYEAALRKQHQALNPRTSWAKVKRKQGVVDEEEADRWAAGAVKGGWLAGWWLAGCDHCSAGVQHHALG